MKFGKRNGACRGLPPLTAPDRFKGRLSKWAPESLRADRKQWAAEMGRRGYSSTEVAEAIGISQQPAYRLMVEGGWDAWEYQRRRNAA